MVSSRILSLADIFGGKLTLVIPDMQRDYCWESSKVATFISGIVKVRKSQHQLSLGLLYGYESPQGSDCINIIDGQQRITTLYLLLGMLYRRVPTDWLRNMLISDYKLIDDRRTRLVYQVQRESQYFLSDLVTQFFLNRNGRLSQLEHSEWYHSCYDSDPSSQHFIMAIRTIDQVLEQAAQEQDWDFAEFARFVACDLSLYYCALDNRRSAEDMFITINTTGQPLTIAQNLRLMSVAVSQMAHKTGDMYAAQMWNEIEDWFWQHREQLSDYDPSCDSGIEHLLSLFSIYKWQQPTLSVEQIGKLNFKELYRFFKAYTRVADAIGAIEALESYPIAMLPAIALIFKFGFDCPPAHIAMLWHMLNNITRYQRPSPIYNDITIALSLIEMMPESNPFSLLRCKGLPERLFNSEERCKLQLMSDSENLPEIQALLHKAERHPMINGRVEKVISWCRDKQTGEVNLQRLDHYIDRIYDLWGSNIDCNPDLDPLRRCLLTLRNPAYPMAKRGDVILSLCWRAYDWQKLLQSAPGLIRNFIDRCDDIDMEQQISRFNDKSYPYYFLIKTQRTVSAAISRQLMRPCAPFIGIHAQGEPPTTYWWIDQMGVSLNKQSWQPMRSYGARCLYTDHRVYDIAIDIYYTPDRRDAFRLEFFNRPDCKREAANLRPIAESYGKQLSWDRRKHRYVAYCPHARSVLALFSQLAASCDIHILSL